jgi:site-specific DNA recombinase
MGRLTLNVLLSFAQFEREVTGERIRDKIAASKRKGMWMGEVLPMGYDLEDRHLVVIQKRPNGWKAYQGNSVPEGCLWKPQGPPQEISRLRPRTDQRIRILNCNQ